MKDTNYFPHDFGARIDPKLQNVLAKHGCAGLGAFWCIVEQIYEQGGELQLSNCEGIAFALRVESTIIESVVKDFGLFENDGVKFWSESINKRLEKRAEIAGKRKKAAQSRWNGAKETSQEPQQPPEEPVKPKRTRFTPPTIEEVKAYIDEKGYSVDAEKFVSFYTSKNWYVGRNKMADWKASVVTWAKGSNNSKSAPSSKVNEIWGE